MVARFLALAASVALVSRVGAQSPYDVKAPAPAGYDRAVGRSSTREHLERLIRLDTRNPPGNELVTALYFDSVFTRIPGVETQVVAGAPNRANLVA